MVALLGQQPAGSDYLYTVEQTPYGPRFVKREARHEDTKLTHERVEEIRNRIAGNLVVSILRANLKEWPLHHLWFPRNTVNCYELRPGKPPPDYERPKHMRGFKIAIEIKPWVVEQFRKQFEQLTNEGETSALDNAFELPSKAGIKVAT